MPTPIFDLVKFCTDKTFTGTVDVRLFASAPVQGPGPFQVSDFVEPVFPGYQRAIGEIWYGKGLNAAGVPHLATGLLNWVCDAEISPVSVLGLIIVSTMGSDEVLLGAEWFKTPKTFEHRGRGLAAIVELIGLQVAITGA